LFRDARQLAESAVRAEDTSYGEAYRLYSEAQQRLDRIKQQYPSSSLAATLANGETRISSRTLAEFREVVRQAKVRSDAEAAPLACALLVATRMEDAAFTLGRIARQYAHVGQYDEALRVARAVDRDLFRALALADVADSYAQAPARDGISELLTEANRAASSIGEGSLRARALAAIGASYASARQMERASETLGEAAAFANKEHHSVSGYNLADIAAAYAKAGQYEPGLKIARSIQRVPSRAGALAAIALSYRSIGRQDDAEKLMREALNTARSPEPSFEIEALVGIAKRHFQAGDKAGGLMLLADAVDAARKIRDAPSRASAIRLNAEAYVDQDEKTTAAALLDEVAGGDTLRARDSSDAAVRGLTLVLNAMALEGTATTYAKSSRFEDAVRVANSIEVEAAKDRAFAEIVGAYAHAGRYQQALQLTNNVQGLPARLDAFANILIESAASRNGQTDQTSSRMCREIIKRLPEEKTAARALMPPVSEQLVGDNEIRVRNPNDFAVSVQVRSGNRGSNFDVPAHGVSSIKGPKLERTGVAPNTGCTRRPRAA
jgi:tetratricopeptide (TPR) repeat protein